MTVHATLKSDAIAIALRMTPNIPVHVTAKRIALNTWFVIVTTKESN